jgi:hypothetical protein
MEAEIHLVFGRNGDGFIYVLTTCRENTQFLTDHIGTNTNGSKDVGLGRINTTNGVRVSNGVAYTIEQLKDYRTNIKVSYEIFQRQGWGAWYGCRDHNNGVYPPTY